MNKAPAFQFYAQDFLTGVMYLTNEEIGIYIKMIAKQWTDGSIPKKRLGFLVGYDWENLSEELRSKFEDRGESLVNLRLEKEREKKERFINKQSENGSKGGRPKKNSETIKPNQNPNKSQKKPLEEEVEVEKEDVKEIEVEYEKVKAQKIVDIFNSVCSNAPKVQKLTVSRKRAINARVKEDGLSVIGNVFQSVQSSRFLSGDNDRGWTADFDWVMKPANFIKILEGKYDNKNGKQKSNSSTGGADDDFRRKTAERLGIPISD